MKIWTYAIIALLTLLGCAWGGKKAVLEQRILNDIFQNYDKRVRPYGRNGTGPVNVEINTYVRALNDLDDVKMLYTAQLTFRQEWYDDRVKFNKSHGLNYLTLTNYDRLWIPDLFFANEMKGHFHRILTPNNLIRIFPDGHILFSVRISLDLFCPMDLRSYPMDRQECNIRAASYGYTTDDIVFKWKETKPVQFSMNLYLPKFSIHNIDTDYCTSRTNTGEYSCIMVRFFFARQFTFYLIRAFMPTMSMVLLSWITFWLHPRSMITRLGILIASLVSITIVTTSVAESGPRVSYMKAIDVWMGTCICFIFAALVEMGLVNNAITQQDDRMRQLASDDTDKMGVDDGAKANSSRPPKYSSTPLRWLNKYSTKAMRIDVVSRFLFPASFVFFNLIFWLTYRAM